MYLIMLEIISMANQKMNLHLITFVQITLVLANHETRKHTKRDASFNNTCLKVQYLYGVKNKGEDRAAHSQIF